MNILLSKTADLPIYEQIKNQIKQSILNEELVEGELLPSMRELAKNLQVSVITTKRAYEDLESEGYVVSVVGKGTYVSQQDTAILREKYVTQIENNLAKVIFDSKLIDLSLKELMELIEKKYKEDE